VHDRDLQLYDGKRLISNERYNFLIEKVGLTQERLLEKGIFPIHPDFSIAAVGEPPNVHSKEGNWMTPEMLSLFVFHDLRTLSKIEEMHVITSKVNSLSSYFSASELKLFFSLGQLTRKFIKLLTWPI